MGEDGSGRLICRLFCAQTGSSLPREPSAAVGDLFLGSVAGEGHPRLAHISPVGPLHQHAWAHGASTSAPCFLLTFSLPDHQLSLLLFPSP